MSLMMSLISVECFCPNLKSSLSLINVNKEKKERREIEYVDNQLISI